MRRLEKQERDDLRAATVRFLLGIRVMYLREHGSTVARDHWDHIKSRMVASARSTETPEEWCSALMKGLRLGAPDNETSERLLALVDVVREIGTEEWFALLQQEWGWFIAKMKEDVEERREEKSVQEQQAALFTEPAAAPAAQKRGKKK